MTDATLAPEAPPATTPATTPAAEPLVPPRVTRGPAAAANRAHEESASARGAELCVIVPTFNERDNVEAVVRELRVYLAGLDWEVVFVDDDSPDGTAEAVRAIARHDRRVRCLQRIGRRGLASACIEGMLSSSATYLAVMDADLQHDPSLLPRMLGALVAGEADVVVGSRYAPGGGLGDWDPARARLSALATRLGRHLMPQRLQDPLSGFFALRRDVIDATARRLSGVGFKILVDLLASSDPSLRVQEIPYEFRARRLGRSKLDAHAAWDFGRLLIEKTLGGVVPVRFVAFGMVGGLGVLVHLAALTFLHTALGVSFVAGQIAATLVAMTFNYALNNAVTYADARLRGWRWLAGWASFTAVCSVGAVANVGVAAWLFGHDVQWLLSGLAGVLVGAVWNYGVTGLYTWRTTSST